MDIHGTAWPIDARWCRGILVWVLAGTVTACAPSVPDDQTEFNLAAAYAVTPLDAAYLADLPEIGFEDPVLSNLMTAALEGNPGLAAARARLRASAAAARAAGAKVSGNGEISASFSGDGAEALVSGLSARIDPARAARQTAALARAEADNFDADDARRLLLEEVVTTYIDLRYYQQLLEFRRADVTSRQRTLNDLGVLLEAGATTEVAVVSARALLVEARGQLPGIEVEALRQRNQLAALTGRSSSDLGINLAFNSKQPLPHGTADRGVPANLLRARPDIQRAERLYAASVADISAARAALYPSLSLSGQVRVPLDGGTEVVSLVPGLSIPIFGRLALNAGVEAAEARAAAAFQQWRIAVLTAVQEVESALASRAAAQRSTDAAEEVVALQRRALNLSRRQLTTGSETTALDILDREQALSQARAALAQNRREFATTHIALLAALGLDRAGTEGAGY